MGHEGGPADTSRAEAIVGAVAFAAERLVEAASWEQCAHEVLLAVGRAAGAGRTAIFENVPDTGGLSMVERLSWREGGRVEVADRVGVPVRYVDRYERFFETLSAGGVVQGPVESLPETEAARLRAEGVRSTAVVPLFVGDLWWGLLVLEDLVADRTWSPLEVEALRAGASIIGAAIDRHRVDADRKVAESRFRAHIENIPAVTYIEYSDPDHPLGYDEAYVSPQITTMFGYTQEEWLHDDDLSLWASIIHPDDRSVVDEIAARTSLSGEPYEAEYRMRRKDGTWVWVRDEAHLVSGEGELRPYWHGVIVDITARKEAEEQVAFLAYHDHLTGLANRAMFEAMLEPALARARRHRLSVVVLFMDVDEFKQVNDAFGHSTGDALLAQIADRLRGVTRETDLVARQGGDEFLVMIPDVEPSDREEADDATGHAEHVAEMMTRRIREAMRDRFDLGEHSVHVTMSVGASIFPLDASDARSLLKNSDTAMYEEKQARHAGAAPGPVALEG
jgi:diguanylate cyclase (GGDEF)-like protein/PAS domain S-box-containing protein